MAESSEDGQGPHGTSEPMMMMTIMMTMTTTKTTMDMSLL
jgi:hypothetical protein